MDVEASSLGVARSALSIAHAIQVEIPRLSSPPDEGYEPRTDQVLPRSLFKNTRGYLEKVVRQVNGSYERGWFDACAVMIRRLLETLIIEAFEAHGIAHKIKNPQDDFLHLSDLVTAALTEPAWNLGRSTKRALKELKDIGDKSAHGRRFVAHRWDIDAVRPDLRVAAQELILLAGFSKAPKG